MVVKMSKNFFPQPQKLSPRIYGYIERGKPELIKIGFTMRSAKERANDGTLHPDRTEIDVLIDEIALRDNGTIISDKEVFAYLESKGIHRERTPDGRLTEWYRTQPCKITGMAVDTMPFYDAVKAVRDNIEYAEGRTQTFGMRPEQLDAVEKTATLFQKWAVEYHDQKPRFLWNAKMRFGKTFTTYQFAKRMGYLKVLVLTFKPAVEESWRVDLNSHIDFDGWQFVSKHGGMRQEDVDKSKPLVVFGSFQDYLGKSKSGGIKVENEWVHAIGWDLIVFDEYHYGAWREKALALTNEEKYLDASEEYYENLDRVDGTMRSDIDELEGFMPITTRGYLYLSGTPFKALNSGEFADDQIFSWTYSDEQRAKQNFKGDKNPYVALPRMVMMTYQLPQSITKVALGGEFNEFDLNTFFKAKGTGRSARFVHEEQVQKWLDIIQGKMQESTLDDLKLGRRPPFPFSDARLRSILQHTIWFLPNVASCWAMRELIRRDNTNNVYFKNNFTLIYAYGDQSPVGVETLDFAKHRLEGRICNTGEHLNKHKSSLETKTITLTCGKLTTGVTVPQWTGIFMLRNLKSPETYFQSAFRVQSPWIVPNPDDPNNPIIHKRECYIFDFAPNRALKQIADYASKLDINQPNTEKKVEEFISFLPVLAYDGFEMKPVDAGELLDVAYHGTTATLLARRWESALLVNVDNHTLNRLINTPEVYEAIMRIEGFRKLGQGFIETIINKAEALNKVKREKGDNITPQEKTQLTKEEKELKSKRKIVQEKLIKFATRIPVFMYLTDFREEALRDVITKIDFELFRRVTGLTVRDFELLVSVGLFNESRMNDAVFKFKRYEEDSLEYTGVNKHAGKRVGGFSTSITHEEFVNIAG